jgi:ACS family hexuronate transporter-like MFS transporter
MIALIFLATIINYIDRQTVSVLKTSISQDLGLSNADYAAVQNSFLLFYGISQMVSGRVYDVIGTRLGFVFSIVGVVAGARARRPARPRHSALPRGAGIRRSRQLARRRQGGR